MSQKEFRRDQLKRQLRKEREDGQSGGQHRRWDISSNFNMTRPFSKTMLLKDDEFTEGLITSE